MNAVSVKSTDPQKLGSIDIQPHYVSEVFYIAFPYKDLLKALQIYEIVISQNGMKFMILLL